MRKIFIFIFAHVKHKIKCLMKCKEKDFGFRHPDLSFEDASVLKLLVSSKLAEFYYIKSHSSDELPYNKQYFEQLFQLNDKLDSFIFSFVKD